MKKKKRKKKERGKRSAHKFRDWQMPQIQFTTNNQFRIERSQVDSWPPFVRLSRAVAQPCWDPSRHTQPGTNRLTHPPITRAQDNTFTYIFHFVYLHSAARRAIWQLLDAMAEFGLEFPDPKREKTGEESWKILTSYFFRCGN